MGKLKDWKKIAESSSHHVWQYEPAPAFTVHVMQTRGDWVVRLLMNDSLQRQITGFSSLDDARKTAVELMNNSGDNKGLKALNLVRKLNKFSYVPIKDQVFAAKLMSERLSADELNDAVFDNLSSDELSARHFERPEKMDPTWGVFFVDTDFLASRRGNALQELKMDRVREMYVANQKFTIPIYDLKSGQVEEGNHRVWLMQGQGYKSVPVKIDGW